MDHEHNPFQCNLGYQVSLSGKGEWNKQSDYVGKEALEKMKQQIKNGEKPYKLTTCWNGIRRKTNRRLCK